MSCFFRFLNAFLFVISMMTVQAMNGVSEDAIQAVRGSLKSREATSNANEVQESLPEKQQSNVINGQFIVNAKELTSIKCTLKKVETPHTTRVSPLVASKKAFLSSITQVGRKEKDTQRSEANKRALAQREEERSYAEKWAFAQQCLGKWQRDINTRYYPVTVKNILAKAEDVQSKSPLLRFETLDQKDKIRHFHERTLHLENEKFYLAREHTLSIIGIEVHRLFYPTKTVSETFKHPNQKDEGRLLNHECIVHDCYNLCSKLQKPEFFGLELVPPGDLMLHVYLSLFLHDELQNAPPLKKVEKLAEPQSCLRFFKTYGANEFFTKNECITINARRNSAAYYLTSLKYVGPSYNYYHSSLPVTFGKQLER